MGCGKHFRVRFGGRRLVPPGLGAGIAVTLVLSVSGAALAAAATNVVPPTGKVAGHGYAYWLQRTWQWSFSGSLRPGEACPTLTSNGQRVGLLTLGTFAPGRQKITCNEPAGRPLYLTALTDECSTLKGDHPNFGTSDTDLKRCAQTLSKPIKQTVTLDGIRVDMKKLIASTDVFRVHIGKHNAFGAPPGNARSAAYGPGLLLTGLETGTHVIHGLASVGHGPAYDITWTVHVG
jgi:hypothetical protein